MIAIAFATFKEALRKKLFFLIGGLTLIYLTIFTLIIYYYMRDVEKEALVGSIQILTMSSQFVSVLGFYFSSMLVALLTIMSSMSSISSEVENGTLHSIITKPINRYEYVLGKYLGLGILSSLYSAFLFTMVLVICKVQNLPVASSFDGISIVKGLGFFLLEPLVILSLCVFGSSTLKTITNGIMVISIYILGLIGSMMEQIGSLINNDYLYKFGILSSLISPFDLIYRQMLSSLYSGLVFINPMMGGIGGNTTNPSKWMIVYIFIYLFGLLFLAIRKFGKKDL